MKNLLVSSLTLILSSGCSLLGIRNEEGPKYIVVLKEDNKEIRKYESYIVARTVLKGSFEDAQKEGFKILAGYIFGKNKSQSNYLI